MSTAAQAVERALPSRVVSAKRIRTMMTCRRKGRYERVSLGKSGGSSITFICHVLDCERHRKAGREFTLDRRTHLSDFEQLGGL